MPPGSKATVRLTFRQPPSPRLEQTLRVFFSVGALGFRATRAAGALASAEHPLSAGTWKALVAELYAVGFTIALLQPELRDWVDLIHQAGKLLKDRLRSRDGVGISAGRNGTNANALGSAEPRQASVLHLRPVRLDGKLRLALIEAPHSRILGQPAERAHGDRGSLIKLAGLSQQLAP